MQVPRLHVVLVEADTDVGRLDLHQLRKRVLEPAADRDRATHGRLVGRQFLAAVGARRIDARPRLVDDHVADVELLEIAADEFGHERLRVAAGRAVADGDHGAGMGLHHLDDLLRRCLALFLLADDVQDGMLERVAALVDHHRLAAALEAGIERQHAAARHRRLQEQVAQVARKDLDGVGLAVFGDLAADLPLEARQHEPGERVADAAPQKIAMGMVGGDKQFLRRRLHLLDGPIDPHLQQLGSLAAVDRQRPMRRHPLHVL